MISIAIDGSSGAGKSSLAKQLAAALGFIYVDTGAMYRSIGLYALRKGADLKDEAQVAALLPEISIRLAFENGEQHIYLNGEDVSLTIRQEQAGMAASAVAAHPAVRQYLLQLQRDLAKSHDLLMDGRDIGTVVLPDATVKIFLTASVEARAARRCLQLRQQGQPVDEEKVKADIEKRDWQDTHRDTAPLRQAEDAVLVDTSDMDLEQSFEALLAVIRRKAYGEEIG